MARLEKAKPTMLAQMNGHRAATTGVKANSML